MQKSTKRSGSRKRVVFRAKRRNILSNPTRGYGLAHPFGVEFKVRRMAQDATVFYQAAQFNVYNNGTGANVNWLNAISTPVADFSGNNQTEEWGLGAVMRLTDVPGNTEFTNLFNEYRIDKVVYRISPVTWGSIGGTASQMPSAYIAWDSNDATAPTTTVSMQERDTCRLVDFVPGKPTYVVGIPRPAQQIYSTGVTTSYGYPSSPKLLWLDCTSPSNATPHYGLKMYFRNFVNIANSGTALRIQPTYYFTFRRTR